MTLSLERILCPVDFSDGSRHALTHACAIARTFSAQLSVLHALAPPVYAADPLMAGALVMTAEDHDRVKRDLADFVRGATDGLAVETVIVEESPVPAVLAHAESWHADLMVIGTHGRRGFERLILGSTTERLLRKATCPVLTVPPRAADATVGAPVSYARVLCAVDFSAASLRALEYAAVLARDLGGRLTLMNVVEPLPVPDALSLTTSPALDIEGAACAAMRTRLHEVAPAGLTTDEVVAVGKPYREILTRAESDRANLIAIGVHGGVTVLPGFLGSTTNHIVREATCPVLSLRA